MNQFDNTPVMPGPSGTPGPAGWVQTWIKAVTKPSEQTFIEIVGSPDATSKTAFIWMFIAGTVAGLVQAVLRTITLALGIAPQMPIPGLEKYMPSGGATDPTSLIVSLITGLCAAPIAGLLTIAFFALVVAIIQWIAKLFGGTGSFEKLAYAFAAISVPITLVSTVFSFISLIPYIGFCGTIFSFVLVIYAIYLEVTATKAVNRFGWGQAVGSVLIPFSVFFIFCCCIIFGLSMALGASLNQFNQ